MFEFCTQKNSKKEACIEKLKLELKKEIIAELFGEYFESTIELSMGQIIKNDIKVKCSGKIRLRGNPIETWEGSKICLKQTGYLTDEDFNKLKPIIITGKHCCKVKDETSIKKAETKAIENAILMYQPRLKNRKDINIIELLFNLKFNRTVPSNTTVCVNVTGMIIPFIIENLTQTDFQNDRVAIGSVRYQGKFVNEFYIDKFEVSVEKYKECVFQEKCSYSNKSGNYYEKNKSDHPMNFINVYEAEEYCRFKGGFLPTRQQWEVAALWTGSELHYLKYPWKSNRNLSYEYLNYNNENCPGETLSVYTNLKGKTLTGLYHMSGNVSEWTCTKAKEKNIIKGGGFDDRAFNLQITNNQYINGFDIREDIGFRCVYPK